MSTALLLMWRCSCSARQAPPLAAGGLLCGSAGCAPRRACAPQDATKKGHLKSATYKRLNLALLWWGLGSVAALWLAPQQPLRAALGVCTVVLAGTAAHAGMTYLEMEPGGLNPLFLGKEFLKSLGNLGAAAQQRVWRGGRCTRLRAAPAALTSPSAPRPTRRQLQERWQLGDRGAVDVWPRRQGLRGRGGRPAAGKQAAAGAGAAWPCTGGSGSGATAALPACPPGRQARPCTPCCPRLVPPCCPQAGLLLQPLGTLGDALLPLTGLGYLLVAVVMHTLKDAAARGEGRALRRGQRGRMHG